MKKTRTTMALLAVTVACAACTGGGDEMSATDQAKMKEGFNQTKGLDESKMSPEQKAGYEKWRNGGGNTAPSAPSGSGAGTGGSR